LGLHAGNDVATDGRGKRGIGLDGTRGEGVEGRGAEGFDGVSFLRGVDDGAVVVGEALLDLFLAGSGVVDEAGAEGLDALGGLTAVGGAGGLAEEGLAVELILEGVEVVLAGELGGEGEFATEGDAGGGRGRD
jgi:hypothetical protein